MTALDRTLEGLTIDVLIPALVLAFLFLMLSVILWKAQKRPDFDVAQFLRDEQGKESAMRAFAFVALAITSWVIATLTFKDKLEPDYFLYYCLTWANTIVLVKAAEKWSGNLPFGAPKIEQTVDRPLPYPPDPEPTVPADRPRKR